jgi:hypothetical protein
MRNMRKAIIWCIAGLLATSGVAAAQSLADIARKEEARRKEVTQPGKRYTNEDLKRLGGAPRAAVPAAEAPAVPADAAAPAKDEAAAKAEQAAKPDEPEKDEVWWKARITDARTKVDRARLLVDALQSRLNALNMDFYARDDPGQRALIAAERDRVAGEMTRLADDITTGTEEIAAIEEEARQAGVPPGWLR